MKTRLQYLYALQEIDKKLDELRENLGNLPEAVAELKDRISNEKKQQKEYEKTIKDSTIKRDSIELDSEALKEKIEKWKKQQFQVKTNRQYDALSREIEMAEKKIKDSVKELESLEAAISAAKHDAELLAPVIEELVADHEERTKELKKIQKEQEEEELQLQHKRDKLAGRIDKKDQREYERIREAKGVAIVAVKRNACSSCYNRVPPQTQLELRQNNRFIQCEHCGVILVSDEVVQISTEFQ